MKVTMNLFTIVFIHIYSVLIWWNMIALLHNIKMNIKSETCKRSTAVITTLEGVMFKCMNESVINYSERHCQRVSNNSRQVQYTLQHCGVFMLVCK